ncbi:MAG: AraC family transcriptional regulator [Fimbriimonadaceae bacterium]
MQNPSSKNACPFHSHGGGISLSEIPGIVRCADRAKLRQAIEQLVSAIKRTDDVEEAKGEALTFVAVVTAATLELGADRSMHRVQLEAARALDKLDSQADIAEEAKVICERVAASLFVPPANPTQLLIDRALQILDRRYGEDLTDAVVASWIGLSTSHFRHLFREVTGQPFSKYLVALRLEKAKKLLVESDLPIGAVALTCGFAGTSHFTRSFTSRFSANPTTLRGSHLAVQGNR